MHASLSKAKIRKIAVLLKMNSRIAGTPNSKRNLTFCLPRCLGFRLNPHVQGACVWLLRQAVYITYFGRDFVKSIWIKLEGSSVRVKGPTDKYYHLYPPKVCCFFVHPHTRISLLSQELSYLGLSLWKRTGLCPPSTTNLMMARVECCNRPLSEYTIPVNELLEYSHYLVDNNR